MEKARERREEMLGMVKLWRTGGETKKSFCLEQGLNIHTFTYWVEKLEREKRILETSSLGFVRLAVGFEGLEIRFPKGATISLRDGMSATELHVLQSLIY